MSDGTESPEPGALSDERERNFRAWVARRLSGWSMGEVLALERWLVQSGELEFVPAIRDALIRRASAA